MESRAYRRGFNSGIGKIQKKINRQKFKCLYHGCYSLAVQCHSQQKERQLRSIAREGLVYALERNFYHMLKFDYNRYPVILRLSGIDEASIFPGYCGKHDRELFQAIDAQSLQVNNHEQAFQLFLRTLSYEFCQKRKAFEFYTLLLKFLKDFDSTRPLDILEAVHAGVKKFLEVDAVYYFLKLWEWLDNVDYSGITTVWEKLDKNLGISSSCVFSPLLDKHEEYMFKNYSNPQPFLLFNLIPGESSTHVVISWLPEHDGLSRWVIKCTENQSAMEKFINQAVFAETEDTCINPNLWESLPEEKQSAVINAMRHEMFRGKLENIPMIVSFENKNSPKSSI